MTKYEGTRNVINYIEDEKLISYYISNNQFSIFTCFLPTETLKDQEINDFISTAETTDMQLQSRLRQKLVNDGGVDRLSSLPEELKLQIFSYLTTFDAANLALSSTGFQRVWFYIPKLLFDYHDFKPFVRRGFSYENFINNIFNKHDNSPVTDVTLDSGDELFIKEAWIKFALDHGVENLKLFGRLRNPVNNMLWNSNLRTIVKLELRLSNFVVKWPTDFCIPNLKKLVLKHVIIVDNDIGDRIRVCFPSLKSLQLYYCDCKKLKKISGTITSLVIFKMAFCIGQRNVKLELVTPSLQIVVLVCLENNGPVPKFGSVSGETATLQLEIYGDIGIYVNPFSDGHGYRHVVKVMKQLLMSESVVVTRFLSQILCDMLKYDPSALNAIHPLRGKKMLQITGFDSILFLYMCLVLISRCVQLDWLSINFLPPKPQVKIEYYCIDVWRVRPQAGLRGVSIINFINYNGQDHHRGIVEYMLLNTPNLEKINLICHSSFGLKNTKYDAKASEIYYYEKASKSAIIDVIWT